MSKMLEKSFIVSSKSPINYYSLSIYPENRTNERIIDIYKDNQNSGKKDCNGILKWNSMPFFSSGEYIIYMKIELCYSNEE
jgi:hypothetical protein